MAVDTLTVQPSAKDNFLYVVTPTTNEGSSPDLEAYDRLSYTKRSILEFSLASLLALGYISIVSATLSLKYYQYSGSDPVSKTLLACKLTRTDWVEAQATWNIYKTGSNWTTAGGDFVTTSPAAASATVPGSYGWIDFNVLAIVQDAYDAAAAAEFLVKFQTEDLASGYSDIFHRSKEYATSADRPKLVIEYVIHPDAPTAVAATDGNHLEEVAVTWTAAVAHTNAIAGYKVYRDGVDISGWLGLVTSYDDEDADAPVISPGAASASRTRYHKSVKLKLSGQSIADGTAHTYKVRAKDDAGYESEDSATDTGYRGAGALSYHWQRSAADAEESFADIDGGTQIPFHDYHAPDYPAGRYFRCRVMAYGSEDAYSAAARGYLRDPALAELRPESYIVIKNLDGEVLAYVRDVGISTDESMNQLPQLRFTVPADSAALEHIDELNEIWLYEDGELKNIYLLAVREGES
jgi:hypothetical protein